MSSEKDSTVCDRMAISLLKHLLVSIENFRNGKEEPNCECNLFSIPTIHDFKSCAPLSSKYYSSLKNEFQGSLVDYFPCICRYSASDVDFLIIARKILNSRNNYTTLTAAKVNNNEEIPVEGDESAVRYVHTYMSYEVK
jgi:hypothetical protein